MSTQELAKSLSELGTDAARQSIEEYTRWYAVSATAWTLFGVVMLVAGIVLFKKLLKVWSRKDMDGGEIVALLFAQACGVVIALIGLWMITHNAATIVSPRAYAIHALIRDVRAQ